MTTHTIQVDDEVLTYLKRRAEPFVDTPNSVLRRELLGNGHHESTTSPLWPDDVPSEVPAVPAGTPKALAQLLQVAHLVARKGLARSEATKLVARHHGVAPQTVSDKYGRQAGLDASRFDQLLAEPSLVRLRAHVLSRFPQHPEVIDELMVPATAGEDAEITSTIVASKRSDDAVGGFRKPLSYTDPGYLRGHAPSGDLIGVWHPNEGRTGFRLEWKGQWYERFSQDEMAGELAIPVRVKKSGSQEGYPAEAVIHAAWRHLVDRYNAGIPDVQYSPQRPAELTT